MSSASVNCLKIKTYIHSIIDLSSTLLRHFMNLSLTIKYSNLATFTLLPHDAARRYVVIEFGKDPFTSHMYAFAQQASIVDKNLLIASL